jgi:hypothetical protein
MMRTILRVHKLRKASLNIFKYFTIVNEDIPIWGT